MLIQIATHQPRRLPAIVHHTPIWVWGLLAALLWLCILLAKCIVGAVPALQPALAHDTGVALQVAARHLFLKERARIMGSGTKRTQRDYTLAFKLTVVEQVEKGELTHKQAQPRYGIQGRSTVLVWLRKHGRQGWGAGASCSAISRMATDTDVPRLVASLSIGGGFRPG